MKIFLEKFVNPDEIILWHEDCSQIQQTNYQPEPWTIGKRDGKYLCGCCNEELTDPYYLTMFMFRIAVADWNDDDPNDVGGIYIEKTI